MASEYEQNRQTRLIQDPIWGLTLWLQDEWLDEDLAWLATSPTGVDVVGVSRLYGCTRRDAVEQLVGVEPSGLAIPEPNLYDLSALTDFGGLRRINLGEGRKRLDLRHLTGLEVAALSSCNRLRLPPVWPELMRASLGIVSPASGTMEFLEQTPRLHHLSACVSG